MLGIFSPKLGKFHIFYRADDGGKVLARPLCVLQLTAQHQLEALKDGLYWAPYF